MKRGICLTLLVGLCACGAPQYKPSLEIFGYEVPHETKVEESKPCPRLQQNYEGYLKDKGYGKVPKPIIELRYEF